MILKMGVVAVVPARDEADMIEAALDSRVKDPRSSVAAAAGGCMLARIDALTEIGGIAAPGQRTRTRVTSAIAFSMQKSLLWASD
jgi:hypothetical protein